MTASDASIREHRDRAFRFLAAGKTKAALREYTALLHECPTDLPARQKVAELTLRLGHREEALQQYRHLVNGYAEGGFLLKAVAICKLLLELQPDDVAVKQRLMALSEQHRRRNREFSVQTVLKELSAYLPQAPPPAPARENTVVGFELDPWETEKWALRGVKTPPAEPPRREAPAPLPVPEPPAATAAEEVEIEVEPPPPLPVATPRPPGSMPPTPLFSDLPPAAFAALAERLEVRSVVAGEVILSEGEPGDALYVVVQGKVRIWRHADPAAARRREQRRECVGELGEGAFFGEIAALSDAPRLATVTAAEPSLIMVVPRETLDDLGREHPEVRSVVQAFYHERLLLNLFSANPMFRRFSNAEQRALIAAFETTSAEPGQVLCAQGRPAAGLFVVLRGGCAVVGTAADGAPLTYPALRPGDVFGEISILLGGPATATVTATSPCVLLRMAPDDVKRLVLANPAVRHDLESLGMVRLERTETGALV